MPASREQSVPAQDGTDARREWQAFAELSSRSPCSREIQLTTNLEIGSNDCKAAYANSARLKNVYFGFAHFDPVNDFVGSQRRARRSSAFYSRTECI